MNKQELIEKIKGLNKLYGEKEYVSLNDVLDLVKHLDEPQKVVVPQFVADWYEEHKDNLGFNIFDYVYRFEQQAENDFKDWFDGFETESFQILVNMHQFGYEVEKEKWYLVKMKGLSECYNYLNYDSIDDEWYFTDAENGSAVGTHHTRKELEDAGFGWVFDCEGIEIEEVEE